MFWVSGSTWRPSNRKESQPSHYYRCSGVYWSTEGHRGVSRLPADTLSAERRAACLPQPHRAPAGAVGDARGCSAALGRWTWGEWQCRWPPRHFYHLNLPSQPCTNTHTQTHKSVRSDKSKQPACSHLQCENKPLESHLFLFCFAFFFHFPLFPLSIHFVCDLSSGAGRTVQ